MHEELKARLLAWTKTSSSFGLDSIGKDIAAALEAIEQLELQLADRDAEIAEYLDAHVLWAKSEDIAQGKLKQQSVNAWHKQYDCDTKLIVKPGE